MTHFLTILGIIAVLSLVIVYPFLPGPHDPLAVTVSSITQCLTVTGLLLTPVAGLWSVYEFRKARRATKNLPHKQKAHRFATACLLVSIVPLLGTIVISQGSVGFSLTVPILVFAVYAGRELIRQVQSLRRAEPSTINPTPLYLIFIPATMTFVQFILARPLTDASRANAIQNAEQVIQEIENHRAAFGRYPESMTAVHKDYSASVVGVSQYHYSLQGDTYNVIFEQPRFLFHSIGTREFVVYNKEDGRHFIPSHAGWILDSSPEQVRANLGWYRSRDASKPHWKSFLFD